MMIDSFYCTYRLELFLLFRLTYSLFRFQFYRKQTYGSHSFRVHFESSTTLERYGDYVRMQILVMLMHAQMISAVLFVSGLTDLYKDWLITLYLYYLQSGSFWHNFQIVTFGIDVMFSLHSRRRSRLVVSTSTMKL